MLCVLCKEGPEILNIVKIQVVQFVWRFMDFLPMAIDGRKYEKKKYQIWFAIVLLTLKSDIYESRLMH
jgi:hypothetical protein